MNKVCHVVITIPLNFRFGNDIPDLNRSTLKAVLS